VAHGDTERSGQRSYAFSVALWLRVRFTYIRPLPNNAHPSTMFHTKSATAILALVLTIPAAAQVPANDDCTNAVVITCGSTVLGSTLEATADDNAAECGTSIGAPGVWYTLEGTGQAVTISTCGNVQYDTKLNVYSGNCDGLLCVTGNDDGGNCELGSTASFPALVGVTYYVLVQGYDGEVGDFELSVDCGPYTSDLCVGADTIACNQSLPGSTLDALIDAAPQCGTGIQAPGVWYTFTGIDNPVLMSTCESFDYDTRINVYQGSCDALVCVVGNDDTPDIGTCSTVNFQPQADLTYYVLVQGYDGETGTFNLELACQTCPPPANVQISATDTAAFIYWQSLNPGATYVIEYGPNGFLPGTGNFISGIVGSPASASITGLTIDTQYALYIHEECAEFDISGTVGPINFGTLAIPPPENAICAGALPITCDSTVMGDSGLSFFTPGPTCGASPITSRGLWYTFTGDGSAVTLSTCGTADFDTKISVFSGGCDALECVAGADDAPGCAENTTSMTFPTVDGTTYYVLVHAFNDGSGTFTLAMTCAPLCAPLAENDGCDAVTIITPVGIGGCEGILGDNTCAFIGAMPNPPCDPYNPIVDLWYSFNTGEQTDHTVIIEAVTAIGVNAALYSACDGTGYIECVEGIDAPVDLTGLALNTTYYLRVWNSGGADAGTFSLCIETDFTISIAEQNDKSGVHIWPNPANDRLMIRGMVAEQYVVRDLQGRIVLTGSANNADLVQVDIAALAPGSYVISGNEGMVGRFVKE